MNYSSLFFIVGANTSGIEEAKLCGELDLCFGAGVERIRVEVVVIIVPVRR